MRLFTTARFEKEAKRVKRRSKNPQKLRMFIGAGPTPISYAETGAEVAGVETPTSIGFVLPKGCQ